MNTRLFTYNEQELKSLMKSLGFPSFRGSQLYHWIHKNHCFSYDQMHTLPKNLRVKLEEEYPLPVVHIKDKQVSQDGTRKYILQLTDGALVETVGIPSLSLSEDSVDRLTVCVSSQVGCAMQCSFCATGKEGFTRNLSAEEIIQQLSIVGEDFNERVSNIVFMGQGEPFLNFNEVNLALDEFNNPESFAIGARHITLSTCGILKGIQDLSLDPRQFTLAISLHSAIQEVRNELLPRCAKFDLQALQETLIQYQQQTSRRITFEYLLINDVNDRNQDLEALITFCKPLHCHINLIPWNAIEGFSYKSSSINHVNQWCSELTNHGIAASVRHSKGSDIAGACGQLKNQFQSQ